MEERRKIRLKMSLSNLMEFEKEDKMACEICGRSSCTRSFHSLQDQEDFDNKIGKYAKEDDDSTDGVEDEQ